MPPRSSRPSTSRRLRGRPSRCRSLVMRRRGVLAGLLLVLAAATRGRLQTYRLAATAIGLEGDRPLDLERPADRAAHDAALGAGRRPAVEHCKLLAYRRDPAGCWLPGLGR